MVGATDQAPPDTLAVSDCTGKPEVLEPKNTVTVIVGESPCAVPADPENAGLSSCVVLPLLGVFNVTTGGAVSTLHDACAGVRSLLPDRLIARTSTACGRSTSAA